ncbi:MAG: AraC family transcriptional regulator [Desulfocapsaceae bacterium]|nr:AraC family transcriptional regulator [Desulfocapsaceae bacterium]
MQKNREYATIREIPELPGLTLMHASYITQNFAKHSHDGFAFGVIEEGVLEFSYRGEKLAACPGIINLVNPGEPHDGHAATEGGWTYRMFYFDTGLLQRAADEIGGKAADLPFFQDGVINDSDLAAEIHSFHTSSFDETVGRLEMESRLLHMLVRFIRRHADASYPILRAGRERPSVSAVKRMIDDLFHQDISLADLAAESGLSPYHLIRVFKAETGLTPHRYLTQVRVRRAEQLIRRGEDLADTAYKVGFADQSHLNRHYKAIIGVTPGAYRNFVQDP